MTATTTTTWEAVIGLEVHVEMATSTKLFCSCKNEFGAEPNTNVCPVCLGLPGSLPVLGERAVEFALRVGEALQCTIPDRSLFHRKNYFYPDMPKDYQISQYDEPICIDGSLDVDGFRVGIERAHMEEDTGKTIHVGGGGRIHEADHSLVDYNRAGIPLMEVVSRPDLRSAEQSRAYVNELRGILQAIGVSDVKMEEGAFRIDANVSLRAAGATELGTKVEVKNMNSIRSLGRALEYEIERQTALLDAGERVVQETRHWDEDAGVTHTMRTKEGADDYRYFPEPDLVPIAITDEMLARAKAALPELPAARAERFERDLGLTADSAKLLAWRAELGDYFEAALSGNGVEPQPLANWVNELVARIEVEDPAESKVQPGALATLVGLVSEKKVTQNAAKQVLDRLVAEGGDPVAIVEAEGLDAIGGGDELGPVVQAALDANPEIAERLRGGDMKPIGVIVGHVMRETRGRADGGEVTRLVREKVGL
jgi:aspartyl-tRNA(Asn)/glutamyl-tRNA(Gln) amidotransferase subunit B